MEFLVKFVLAAAFVVSATLADDAGNVPTTQSQQYPLGDVRNCPTRTPHNDSQPLYRMEVLPGVGFDNLRSLDMGQVMAYNFSSCQVSKDGLYLLPDSTFVTPIQESRVEVFAEYFDHWDNYTSMTSTTIGFEAGFFSLVNAKFSAGYSSMKTHQYRDKSKTTRVQIRDKVYTVKMQPGAQLHHTFKAQLFDIASKLQNNNTDYAHYLAELLVRDYGTHAVTSMEAGAILSQTDFLRSTSEADGYSFRSTATASASANFFGKVKLGATFAYSSSQADNNGFINNRTYSELVTIGGPPFRPNLTLEEWQEGVPNALVAIDRSGDPLHFLINPSTLPELPETTVRRVSNIVRQAINRYYKINTRHGCTQPDSENFQFQANVDDHSCVAPSTNFSFGGIYQTCTQDPSYRTEDLCNGGPEPASQVNPLTGDFSCPDGFTSIKLHSGKVSHVVQKPVCNNVCHHCGLFGWKRCCQCQSVLAPFLSVADYDAYWCAALPGTEVPQNTGYLFGGYYTSTTSNPFTNSMSCPRYYYPLHFGEDMYICTSTDYELGFGYSVNFAGFDSCSVGNPLAATNNTVRDQSKWPHACPPGYAQHLVTVDEGCEINFCVEAGSFLSAGLLPVKLPPFRKHPKYKTNVTDALVVFGVYGRIWVKNEDGLWDRMSAGSSTGQELLTVLGASISPSSDDSGSNPDGLIAGVTVLGTVMLGILVALLVFTGRTVYKRRRRNNVREGDVRTGYVQIEDTAEPEAPAEPNPTSEISEA